MNCGRQDDIEAMTEMTKLGLGDVAKQAKTIYSHRNLRYSERVSLLIVLDPPTQWKASRSSSF